MIFSIHNKTISFEFQNKSFTIYILLPITSILKSMFLQLPKIFALISENRTGRKFYAGNDWCCREIIMCIHGANYEREWPIIKCSNFACCTRLHCILLIVFKSNFHIFTYFGGFLYVHKLLWFSFIFKNLSEQKYLLKNVHDNTSLL